MCLSVCLSVALGEVAVEEGQGGDPAAEVFQREVLGVGVAAVQRGALHADAVLRGELFEVGDQLFGGPFGVLSGGEAHGDFGVGGGGDDGLGAGAGVAAPEAADVQRGTDAAPFEGGVAALAARGVEADGGGEPAVVEGGGVDLGPLGGAELPEVVVEAGDGDPTGGVVGQGAEQVAEGVGGVDDGAAVKTGVEVAVGAGGMTDLLYGYIHPSSVTLSLIQSIPLSTILH